MGLGRAIYPTTNILSQYYIICKQIEKDLKKTPALADEKENNNPFCQQANATLTASASLCLRPEKRRSRAPLFSIDEGFLFILLWIFFAFSIVPRRLILLYQKISYISTNRLTFFVIYHKILLKNIGKKLMKKLFNLRPILFFAISLCCGISTAYFFERKNLLFSIVFALGFAISLIAFFFIFTSKENKKRNGVLSICFAVFFVVGVLGFSVQLNQYSKANLDGHYYEVSGKVIDCNSTDVGASLVLGDVYIKGNRVGKIKYNVSVLIYGKTDVDIGDLIQFSAQLKDRTFAYEGKFNASDVERGIKYYTSISAEDVVISGKNLTIFEMVNLAIRNTLSIGLDKDEFAVGYALLTGNSSFMDRDVISSYRTAGVAHIFAVSGLHIGFLATALAFVLKKLKAKGMFKAVITTLVLLFYSGVCGFSASSLRATVMCSVALFARAKGERYDTISATSFAMILILLCSPVQLFSVGFQLSFGVVLGINLLSKPIARLFKFLPKKLADGLGVVLSAQIVVIPIMLYAFKEFSIISIIANLIFVPIVSVIFTLTMLGVILGLIFCAPVVTLFLSNYSFKFINLCIAFFDQNFFMVGGFSFGGAVIFYFASLIVASGIINLRKITKTITALTLALICFVMVTAFTSIESRATKVYVSGAENICATMILSGDENTLVVSDTSHVYSASRLKRIKNDSKESEIDNLILMGGYSVDIQVFLTKLHTVFSVKNVIYYGEKDALMEDVVKKSFKGIRINNVFDEEPLLIESFPCKFLMQGNALTGEIKGKSIVIFSAFKKGDVNFSDFSGGQEIMVCADRAEQILSRYSPQVKISYRQNGTYDNAENNGNMLFKIY